MTLVSKVVVYLFYLALTLKLSEIEFFKRNPHMLEFKREISEEDRAL
jgi:hypothetical protein